MKHILPGIFLAGWAVSSLVIQLTQRFKICCNFAHYDGELSDLLQSLGHVSLPDSIGYLETSFVTINGIFILFTSMPFRNAGLFGRVFIHLYTHFKIGVF